MGKNSLLELEKDLNKLKDRELKDREVKYKREIQKLFFKPIMVSIDNMDKFEQKEMKKIRQVKITWYDWLIDYIPAPIRKGMVVSKIKSSVFLRQTHLSKLYMGEERN